MRWLDDMNRAMDYIEATLCEKTDYEKIAQTACCSVYHFQRMFTFMTDLTLSAYIRRRKMTLAAFDLLNSDMKVIDIAMKYGYDSPESFTRAFKTLHGITPTEVRTKGTVVKAFPRMSFQITIQGACAMNYQIVEKEAFQVYGTEIITDSTDDQDLTKVPEFWLSQIKNGENQRLVKSAGAPTVVNAVMGYRELPGAQYPYMLCVMKTPLSNTDGYKVVDIPKSTWAIFENEPHEIAETSEKLDELTRRIYKDWLPTADFEFDGNLSFEMYYSDQQGKFFEQRWFRVKPRKSDR